MPENNDCPDCLGCGIIDLSTVACPACKGTGKVTMDKKQNEFEFTEDKLVERASNLSRLSGYQSFEETADSALYYLREAYKQGWNAAIIKASGIARSWCVNNDCPAHAKDISDTITKEAK